MKQQVERLTSVCRLFVPLYRQITVTSLMPGFPKPTAAADHAADELAQADVSAAWDYYIKHFNAGRPFVLIGHSQGSFRIIKLVQERIDNRPLLAQLLSVILPGAGVVTPIGRNIGGTFKSIPPCRTSQQIGCVIAFNSVRADSRLPLNMKLDSQTMESICTNPAALGGGSGALKPYFSTSGETIIPAFTAKQAPWMKDRSVIQTPFVTTPGLYRADCRRDEHGALLIISTQLKPDDRRTGALAGDWLANGAVEPTMGLHLIDLNLTEGNLIDIISHQIRAMESVRTGDWR